MALRKRSRAAEDSFSFIRLQTSVKHSTSNLSWSNTSDGNVSSSFLILILKNEGSRFEGSVTHSMSFSLRRCKITSLRTPTSKDSYDADINKRCIWPRKGLNKRMSKSGCRGCERRLISSIPPKPTIPLPRSRRIKKPSTRSSNSHRGEIYDRQE